MEKLALSDSDSCWSCSLENWRLHASSPSFSVSANARPTTRNHDEGKLKRDKDLVLGCWEAMGGCKHALVRKWYNAYGYLRARDEPSDDVSEWLGVTVEGGRVTELYWRGLGLENRIPEEIGELDALTYLDLSHNELTGDIPPSLGALTSLVKLNLGWNGLSGEIPYSLSKLMDLRVLILYGFGFGGPSGSENCLDGRDVENSLDARDVRDLHGLWGKPRIRDFFNRDFFAPQWRHPAIDFLNYGIAITKRRHEALPAAAAAAAVNPFLGFLATHSDDLTILIMSYLDPYYCCSKDRTALLKCWKSLGGGEGGLRRRRGDDVARWKGVKVKGGRVVKVNWNMESLKGALSPDVGELDGLRYLGLCGNEISSIPPEIGKLASLTSLSLDDNHLADLPRELGSLRSLTRLSLGRNRLSVLPSSLSNLANLDYLSLWGNNFTIDVPSTTIQNYRNNGQVQTFLSKLKEN